MRSNFFNPVKFFRYFLYLLEVHYPGSDALDWVLFGLVDRKWLMLQGQVISLEIYLGRGFG
jgi:hypothetical protein